jgi:D-alanyl-lipoteichoic acid acyltransferase DltB (MBOAT superfamily)
MRNFRHPYFARNVSDFWQRWHISLSTWLRDYLYIPLGGNRGGWRKQYRNLMLTMVLGGLWHGASMTFIAWGTFHGLILCVYRALGIPEVVASDRPAAGARRALRVIVMFHLVCLGWLFFRADNFPTAFAMLRTLVTRPQVDLTILKPVIAEMALLAGIPLLLELALDGERNLARLARAPVWVQCASYAYVAVMLLFLHAGKANAFIYFQF